MSLENDINASMDAALHHLHQELKTLRTGRANPALLDGIMVDVYGTSMRIKDLANVTVPESRQLLISPYDVGNMQAIVKAIETSKVNLQPVVEKNVIRISIPPMDKSIRMEMVKQCKKKGEDAKVAIRDIRRKFNELVRKQKNTGELSEDILKQKEKKIQEMTDRFCKLCDQTCVDKEKEILEI